ncbi:MAG: hypothetical protein NTV43_15865 [Methylococcales bacterium]|nr:hypothetical protein [Methylococcales bacterium]
MAPPNLPSRVGCASRTIIMAGKPVDPQAENKNQPLQIVASIEPVPYRRFKVRDAYQAWSKTALDVLRGGTAISKAIALQPRRLK